MAKSWVSLDVTEKLAIVLTEITDVTRELTGLSAPEGPVDTAMDVAIDAFTPLLEFMINNRQEPDDDDSDDDDDADKDIDVQINFLFDSLLSEKLKATQQEKIVQKEASILGPSRTVEGDKNGSPLLRSRKQGKMTPQKHSTKNKEPASKAGLSRVVKDKSERDILKSATKLRKEKKLRHSDEEHLDASSEGESDQSDSTAEYVYQTQLSRTSNVDISQPGPSGMQKQVTVQKHPSKHKILSSKLLEEKTRKHSVKGQLVSPERAIQSSSILQYFPRTHLSRTSDINQPGPSTNMLWQRRSSKNKESPSKVRLSKSVKDKTKSGMVRTTKLQEKSTLRHSNKDEDQFSTSSEGEFDSRRTSFLEKQHSGTRVLDSNRPHSSGIETRNRISSTRTSGTKSIYKSLTHYTLGRLETSSSSDSEPADRTSKIY